MSQIRRYESMAAVSMLAMWAALPATAVAQETTAQPAASQAAQEPVTTGDIVVTGTRLQNAGFDAPTPVSVVTAEQIQRAAPATISDFVNQIPALSGSNTPRTNKALIGNGLAGANLLNLRNLGVSRTLVLMNGKRVTPTTLTGAVDVNTLPNALVKRVDIVTGGASAAWGSDAVAGVVNFVLDTDYEGLKGNFQSGISTEGDASNLTGSLSYGKAFADGKGHFLVSGQYTRNGSATYGSRDWFKAYKIVNNPLAGQPGETTFLAAPWTAQFLNETGLVASGPLAGYYFDPNGNLAGTDFPLANRTGNGTFYFGDKAVFDRLYDQSPFTQSSVPTTQKSIYARASYDLTDNINAYVEGSYATSKAHTRGANYGRSGASFAPVALDNFYLPEEVRSAMIANGLTTLPLNVQNTKMGVIGVGNRRKSYRGLVGLDGSFGGDWKWSAYYQYGRVDSKIRATDMPRPDQYLLAIDAVANPVNPSQPICRSTLTNPTNGCVPMNPFGSQALSPAVLNNVIGVSAQDIRYEQHVAAANLAGNLFELPAGPVSFAAGAEYRSEKAHATADPISQRTGFWAGNFKAFDGKINVKEVYGELGVPVFKDSAFGRSLDLNVAGRLTDYSVSGSVKTWKAGFRYEPIDGVELRLTRSRDIRAPNLQELFQAGSTVNTLVNDPVNGNTPIRAFATVSGNTNLTPENADTLTAGIVLRPSFLRGFRASIDYYDIKIKEAIATNSAQFIVDRCFAGDAQFCTAITRNSANVITAISLQPFNALQERARGVDIEVSYTMPIADGTFDVRVLANYVDKLDIVLPTSVITRAGEVSNNVGAAEGVPHWRATASATYDSSAFTAQLRGRLIGSAVFDDNWGPTVIDKRTVPAIFYLDAYLGIKTNSIAPKSEFFLAVDNLLNQDPPVVVQLDASNTQAAGTNPFLYDVIGTTIRAGFRFEF
ncbi:TonB-dependent receptor [Sphingobium lactosutens]|uniref:TonB-dependent receptor domain-containing protein n=1 Tax=Sphingobium lactosutens TaxID=522773 RepID=UPI0015BBA52F|nr:TonB-dependent receptor [Sphingobium lactosutens]NWK99124.1 TonB-dependent receptor [Sphingobium lactosutens]